VDERPEVVPMWPQQEAPEPREQPAPETPQPREAEPALDEEGRPALPRRRRQASLAPQLRESAFKPEEPEDAPDDGRSPEEIRGIMSAFHRESRRARDDDTGANE
jgi:hypothetical protein